jgi:hypothetical protein
VGISIVVERSVPISLDEWNALVEADSSLRFRSEPHSVVNPATGALISMNPLPAESEFGAAGQWQPFLSRRRGHLVCAYKSEFENEKNPIRLKLSELSRKLGAVLKTDAGEETLEW